MSLLRQSKLDLPPDLAAFTQALDDNAAELRWGRALEGKQCLKPIATCHA
jgi:hypothetical protein